MSGKAAKVEATALRWLSGNDSKITSSLAQVLPASSSQWPSVHGSAAQSRGWSSASALDRRHARSRAMHLVVLVVTRLLKGREGLRLG